MTFADVRGLELFEGLSDQMLHELVDASQDLDFEPGDVLWIEGQQANFWWVLLEGHIEVVRHVGREVVVMASLDRAGQWAGGWAAFDPQGVYLVTGRPTTAGRIMRAPVAALRDLMDGVPVMKHLVDGLFQTARHIESNTRQREALVALGTLSAGLAHELNNPAAAATRAVDSLSSSMHDVTVALRALAAEGISAEQFAALDALAAQAAPPAIGTSPLALADREEELSEWLADHALDRDWVLGPALASASFTPQWCQGVLDAVGPHALQPALDWAAASVTSSQLIAEVKDSTQRISGLVDSVKSYSQMDRGSLQRVDVTEGLESTLVMLAHKLRHGVEVVRDYAADVPEIEAYAGELNQVWTNLIDNAIDAMDGVGVLTLTTTADGDHVVVTVADSGAGMRPEVIERAFDTFFTTKEVGKGTGLGLSICRRIVVERHGGDISVESEPGRTAFRIALPVRQRT